MLTVVTHTHRKNPYELERMVRSVEAALPQGAKHIIVDTPTLEHWRDRRWRDLISSEFTAIVDDDDEIHPDSLHICLDAIKKHDVGIVFTDEVDVSANKSMRSNVTGIRKYSDCIANPRAIHHLCMYRASYIDHDMDEALKQTKGIGVDWMIKASATLNGGALHIPMPGYYWYQQPPHIEIRRNTERLLYRDQRNRQRIVRVIRQRYGMRDGLIPQLEAPVFRDHIPEMMR